MNYSVNIDLYVKKVNGEGKFWILTTTCAILLCSCSKCQFEKGQDMNIHMVDKNDENNKIVTTN